MNILITGTSSGLGLALASQYLKNGASVYGISRRVNNGLMEYKEYHHLSQDLSLLDELPVRLAEFLSEIDTLDLVILNAGTLPNANYQGRLPVSEVTRLMQVNVWANKIIIDTLRKIMTKIYQVVAVSSGTMFNNIHELHTYTLSKSILNKWVQLYSKEAPGIHFTALAPGIVDSGLQEYITKLPNLRNCPEIRKLKKMRKKGEMASTYYAANLLVEVMGSVLQRESGSYFDTAEITASGLVITHQEKKKTQGMQFLRKTQNSFSREFLQRN